MKSSLMLPVLVFILGSIAFGQDRTNLLVNYLLKQPNGRLWFDVGPVDSSQEALAVQADKWIDKFDAILRAQFPSELQNVPKPRALINMNGQLSSYAPNASVKGFSRCLHLPLKIKVGDRPPVESSEVSLHFFSNGQLAKTYGTPQGCISENVSLAELPDYLDLAERYWGCPMKIEGDLIQVQKGCTLSQELRNGATSKTLILLGIPNVIFVNGALGEALGDQTDLSAVLAHELGHYYLAHSSRSTENIGSYYFDAVARRSFEKPAPISAELAKQLDVTNLFIWSEFYNFKNDPSQNGKPYFRGPRDLNQAVKILTQVNEHHLAYYSAELIADEFSALLLEASGLDPQIAVGLNLNWKGRSSQFYPPLFGPSPEQCRTLRANKWKDPQGNDAFVPFGTFEDAHGSRCFRGFNLARQLSKTAR